MARTIDFAAMFFIAFLISFSLSTLFLPNWGVCLAFAVATSVGLTFFMRVVYKRNSKPYSVARFELEAAIRGDKWLVDLLMSTATKEFARGDDYVIIDDCAVISRFRFTPLNQLETCFVVRKAVELGVKRVYVLVSSVDRKAFKVSAAIAIEMHVIKSRTIFRYLKRNNALPPLVKPQRLKSLPSIIEAVFRRSNFKNYVFSGTVLIVMSFVTPLKIYYIVLGAITLFLAALTLTPLGTGVFNDCKILDKLK